uniref:DDE-1 domain-containing protein n=1 Tax=Heterorhabditis bacteriophora TaxID=37862 RepID=A0A1I7X070_HETBA
MLERFQIPKRKAQNMLAMHLTDAARLVYDNIHEPQKKSWDELIRQGSESVGKFTKTIKSKVELAFQEYPAKQMEENKVIRRGTEASKADGSQLYDMRKSQPNQGEENRLMVEIITLVAEDNMGHMSDSREIYVAPEVLWEQRLPVFRQPEQLNFNESYRKYNNNKKKKGKEEKENH